MKNVVVKSRKITQEEARQCASEQIQHIGTIQDYGFCLTVDHGTGDIVQCSENILSLLKKADPTAEITSDLNHVIGSSMDSWVEILDRTDFEPSAFTKSRSVSLGESAIIKGSQWECACHFASGYLCLEFIPLNTTSTDSAQIFITIENIVKSINSNSSSDDLFATVTNSFQQYTHYDRVMMYKFLGDMTGEVVAESVSSSIPSADRYLGLRFPEEDIPKQARELFKRNSVRIIADLESNPCPLYPQLLPNNQPLDQSDSSIRSVSNMHVRYLLNMGVKASMSIALIHNGELWGLVAFHNYSPLNPHYHMVKNLKTSCELIANLMNGYLHPSRDLEATKKLLIDKSNVDQVVNDFERSFTFKRVPALLKALQHIFDVPLIGCFTQSQAIALHNGALLELEENHKESIEQLFPDARSLIVQHDCLIKDGYSCAKAFPGIAGILAKRSPSKGELCFFLGKNELSQQVNWAGEPCTVTEVLNGGERGIEPRGSFKAWAQKVSGCSEAWSSTEVELQDYMFNKLNALFSKEVKQQLQEQLEEQALHDSLTLLPNRRKLRNFIEEFMIDRRRSGYLALLLIDMDNFKNINDYFGHDVGDRFLIEVADRLRHSIRPQDLAVRLGGDEFVVVFTGLYQSLQDTTDIVKKLTEKILERLRVPLDCKDNVIASSPSIGITIFDPIKSEFNEVIKQADTAMYQAKALGKNCYRLFDSADQERINEELKCLFELREAIANLNIDVHYQAKWKDNKVVGAEALARWKRDGVSFEPPGKFIRLAEKNGLIKQLGMVVLEKVCMDIAKTPAKLKDKLHISVNVSSQQMLDELFIPELKKVIGKHAVEPKTIRLEITETLFIERFDKAVEVLNELRALGFTISIDDFGTGYSSFSWLKMLPIDEVKIDKSFIDNIVCSEKDLKLVSGMIDLFERLHLDVVVEGVEEEEQAVLLKSIGGKIFQGFFFSRPEPFTQIEAWQC